MRHILHGIGPCLAAFPHQFEPVEQGGAARIGVALGAMGPKPLARDHVLEAVAVHVDHVDRMGLRKLHAIEGALGGGRQDRMLDEVDVAVRLLHMLEPREPVAVGDQARDHILIAVAIDVVDVHLGSAFSEGEGMLFPGLAGGLLRLFPPALGHQQVGPSVAVHVADPQTVLVLPPLGRLRAAFEGPAVDAGRFARMGEAEHAAGVKHEFGLAVARDVGEGGRLIVDDRKREVAFPSPGLFRGLIRRILAQITDFRFAGVPKPRHLLAGPDVGHHVEPAVAVDVGHEGDEVVGVFVRVEILRGVNLVPRLEVGAGVPEGAIDGIDMAVVVDVANAGALGVKVFRELNLREASAASRFGSLNPQAPACQCETEHPCETGWRSQRESHHAQDSPRRSLLHGTARPATRRPTDRGPEGPPEEMKRSGGGGSRTRVP